MQSPNDSTQTKLGSSSSLNEPPKKRSYNSKPKQDNKEEEHPTSKLLDQIYNEVEEKHQQEDKERQNYLDSVIDVSNDPFERINSSEPIEQNTSSIPPISSISSIKNKNEEIKDEDSNNVKKVRKTKVQSQVNKLQEKKEKNPQEAVPQITWRSCHCALTCPC